MNLAINRPFLGGFFIFKQMLEVSNLIINEYS